MAAQQPSPRPPVLPPGVASRYVMVGDIRTHYLEAGEGEPLMLIHSAEFGGRAEFSWRYNIEALAQHYHVYAPDIVGFGRSSMIYNWSNPSGYRIDHVRRFMETLCIPSAHFIGNSFGGSLTLTVASFDPVPWKIRSIIAVSGGGNAPDNDARKVLTLYDGTRDGMREILKVLFWDARWWADEMVDERWQASIEPGAWEACAAARFAPANKVRGFGSERGDPANIAVPTLVIAGEHDLLREPGYWRALRDTIPGAEAHVYDEARHCAHVEHPDHFNRLALEFLQRVR
jgi:pimeloyl-ACP methyl ester carboxylesterase